MHTPGHWSSEFTQLRVQMRGLSSPLIQVDSVLHDDDECEAHGSSYMTVQPWPSPSGATHGDDAALMTRPTHDPISGAERQLLANLLRASGRDPSSFVAVVQPDGLVRVSGPRGTAFYPRENWFTRFSRHLDNDFFDPQQPEPGGPRFSRRAPSLLPA